MSNTKPTRGHPRHPPGTQRTTRIRVSLNADEHAQLQVKAAAAGRPLARWLREVALSD